MENRIWIELDNKPPKEIKADKRTEFHNEQCRLANNLLKRLFGDEPAPIFFYSERSCTYCLRESGMFRELSDSGEWFNLDYLGREQ